MASEGGFFDTLEGFPAFREHFNTTLCPEIIEKVKEAVKIDLAEEPFEKPFIVKDTSLANSTGPLWSTRVTAIFINTTGAENNANLINRSQSCFKDLSSLLLKNLPDVPDYKLPTLMLWAFNTNAAPGRVTYYMSPLFFHREKPDSTEPWELQSGEKTGSTLEWVQRQLDAAAEYRLVRAGKDERDKHRW